MARGDSEEQLGEEASAGEQALEADRKGLAARWGVAGNETLEEITGEQGPPEGIESPIIPGMGGEPEVGGTRTRADEENRA